MVGLKALNEDLVEIRKIFQQLDTNKDGYIDDLELRQGMAQVQDSLRNKLGSQPDWETLFEHVDADNDGRISYDEFCTAAYN